jgi:hypothetical protein
VTVRASYGSGAFWFSLAIVTAACGAAMEARLDEVAVVEAVATTIPPGPQVATVTVRPDRGVQIQVTDTLPPSPPLLTARQIVNLLPYAYSHPEPAMQAYRIVATEHGWTSARIEAWAPFVNDVMKGESYYCWNLLRGGIMVGTDSCQLQSQGTHEDAGFAQLTSISGWGAGLWMCVEHGICSRWDVIRDPWTSMESFLWLLERDGSKPWCFNSWAIRYHHCNVLAPDR